MASITTLAIGSLYHLTLIDGQRTVNVHTSNHLLKGFSMALAFTVRPYEDIVFGDPKNPIGRMCVTEIKRDGTVVLAFKLPREFEINRKSVAESKAKNK